MFIHVKSFKILIPILFVSLIMTCRTTVSTKNTNISSTPPGLSKIIKAAWEGICSTKSNCSSFDYFPNGGMRNFYCHVINYIKYEKFVSLIGVSPFVKGPHNSQSLNLESKNTFGYYNPSFVIKLGNILIPGEKDVIFKKSTQPIYDNCIKGLARIFFVTYEKLMKSHDFIRKEKKEYLDMIQMGKLDPYHYEKYFYFMNKNYFINPNEDYLMSYGFDGGWNGNVVKTCVAFWIRRSIDGTSEQFYRGLVKLLETYDKGFVAEQKEMDL